MEDVSIGVRRTADAGSRPVIDPAAAAAPAARRDLAARLATVVPWRRWERPLVLGNAIAAALAATILVLFGGQFGLDAEGWWTYDPLHPYGLPDYGAPGAYFYSPAFSLVFAPFHLLPFGFVVGLIVVFDLLCLRWLVGRWAGYALLLLPVMHDIRGANIDIPLAAAVVAGFRYPALWTAVLLTKVTPGIGLLWFAVRREWRSLAIVAVVTGAIVAVSFAIAPDAWFQWIALLRDNAARPLNEFALPIPLWIRLIVAAVIVVVGATRNWRWVVPIAAFLGIAVIWQSHYVLLLGIIPLVAQTDPWRAFWSAYSGRPLPIQSPPAAGEAT